MKKLVVIGEPTPELLELLKTNEYDVIVVKREEEAEALVDVNILRRNEELAQLVSDLKPLEIKSLPMLEMPFIPKAKHSPKGHERPYKFHK